jgi:hypothetical protein
VCHKVITAASVLEQIAAHRARGVRVLLVELDCRGGAAGVGWAIHDALAAFSADGGKVVMYVEKAGSSAVDVALAADFIVCEQPTVGRYAGPPGYLVHAALANPRLTLEENARIRERVRAETLKRIAHRVATPEAELTAWLSIAEEEGNFVGAWLSPEAALAHAWGDLVGDRTIAVAVAHSLAAGECVSTYRATEGAVFGCPAPLRMVLPSHPFPGGGAAPEHAQAIAMGKNASDVMAAPPTSPAPVAGDVWFNSDTTTNCPDSNCQGHTLASGTPQVGSFPHRKLYWPHAYNGSAWKDNCGAQAIVAADIVAGAVTAAAIAAGSITADRLSANAIQTTNYAEDGSGNPTAGAKLQVGGTALKVATLGLQLGNYTIERQIAAISLADFSRRLFALTSSGLWVCQDSYGQNVLVGGGATGFNLNGNTVALSQTTQYGDGVFHDAAGLFLAVCNGVGGVSRITLAGAASNRLTTGHLAVAYNYALGEAVMTPDTITVNTAGHYTTDAVTISATTFSASAIWQGVCSLEANGFLVVGNDASNNVVGCYGTPAGWTTISLPSNTGGTVSTPRAAAAQQTQGVVCAMIGGLVIITTYAYTWVAVVGSNLASSASWTRYSNPGGVFAGSPQKAKQTNKVMYVSGQGAYLLMTMDGIHWRKIYPSAYGGYGTAFGTVLGIGANYYAPQAQGIMLVGTVAGVGAVLTSGLANETLD